MYHVRDAMAAYNPRSASPGMDYPPPPPPARLRPSSSETGNTNTRVLSSGAEETFQSRAQTLDPLYRKASSTEVPGKVRGQSLRSPTRKKPTMSVIAEPTTKIKVSDVVENCRYSGWVRKQGGSYKSCEFGDLIFYLLRVVCAVECVLSYSTLPISKCRVCL